MNFQKTLLKLHLYVALITAIPLFLIALTGSVLVFEKELDRIFHPQLFKVEVREKTLPVENLFKSAHDHFPDRPIVGILFSEQPDSSWECWNTSNLRIRIDPYDGRILGTRDLQKGFLHLMRTLHTHLSIDKIGKSIVGYTTLFSLFMFTSGLILWWPRKKLTIRPNPNWYGLNTDLHHTLGFYACFLLAIISLSGVMMSFKDPVDGWVKKLNQHVPPSTPKITIPADAKRISLDEALKIADQVLPSATTSMMVLPRPGDNGPILVSKKFPEDQTPAGRSRIFIDPYKGTVLQVINTRQAEWGTFILNLENPIHTGRIFGITSLIFYLLASLILITLIFTGLVMWFKKK